jgi:MEMO1 family protein
MKKLLLLILALNVVSVSHAQERKAASEDTRFAPVSNDEINRLRIEISVLGPLKKIRDTSEIIIGRHGICIEKKNRTGTMLPQVASGNHWTREQFLGYTSRDKAGLGWEGWKNADIYIYETVILHPAE